MIQRRLKIEQLERRLLLASDFGDAPEPYDTLLADGGAEHEAVGPTLGLTRDSEPEGTPSPVADGDGSDEDGVTFGTIQVGALDATVTVNVQGGAGKLDAWIDFNGDGSWGSPRERVFASHDVVVGDNLLTFDVPSDAIAGTTYARFRLSTAGGLGVTGPANDGEVEDYAVFVTSPTTANREFSPLQPISTSADGATDVFAADLDSDGDLDVLSASSADDKIAWYENDGNQNFTEHTISTSANVAFSVFAADLDGDGDLDVLSASFYGTIAWYENDGNQNFTEHTISTSARTPRDVFAADVDGDGDLDVLSASSGDDKIAWYENDGSQNFTEQTINTSADGAHSVFAADLDGDGDLDVLSASFGDDKIVWYENNGSQNFTEHTISTSADGARSVFAADVDGDGDLDVLSASFSDDKIAWYENNGSQNFTEHTISTSADGAHSVFAADLNGDGDLDVLSASVSDDTIAWYKNDGNQTFTKHTISTSAGTAQSVFVADVDGDGDLDVLSASAFDDTIAWFENNGPADYGDAPSPYPTTFFEFGARHAAVGPTLGATRDAEADGTPSSTADGDGADEDGITVSSMRVGQLGATVDVEVQNAPDGAYLYGWIDFNGDGKWLHAAEWIVLGAPVTSGSNQLTFDVPNDAAVGTTYARFRLSTDTRLSPVGPANDGEVEDYEVEILPQTIASGRYFDPVPVVAGHSEIDFLLTVDFDQDGDNDLISGTNEGIYWYEHTNGLNFESHQITPFVSLHVSVVDLDRDGDLDILSSTYPGLSGEPDEAPRSSWFENRGQLSFVEHSVWSIVGSSPRLDPVDFDQDGDFDLVQSTGIDPSHYIVFENDGNQNFSSDTRYYPGISTTPLQLVHADFDGDGDLDIAQINDAGEGIELSLQANSAISISPSGLAVSEENEAGSVTLFREGNLTEPTTARIELGGTAIYGEDYTLAGITNSGNGHVLVDFPSNVDSITIDFVVVDDTLLENVTELVHLEVVPTDSAPAEDSTLVVSITDNDVGDFGDAPLPYPTSKFEYGAGHRSQGPQLGAVRSNELDGQASTNAATDIGDDGITFSTIQVGQLDATATVNVQNAPAGAKLEAWIDWNNDGSWGGAGEQIAASWSVVEGDNMLEFDVPADSLSGRKYARFRLSTEGGLAPGGIANDGEVEDYALTTLPPEATPAEALIESPITTLTGSHNLLEFGDLDGDGDLDVISGYVNGTSGRIAWYENNGQKSFSNTTVISTLRGPSSLKTADIDGDGNLDLVASFYNSDVVAWYENDGIGNFQEQILSSNLDGASSVDVVDFDSDGDMDVIASAFWGDTIEWYENNGEQIFTKKTVTATVDGPVSTVAVDVDSDGDLDLLTSLGQYGVSNAPDDQILWFENDGHEDFTLRLIDDTVVSAGQTTVADIDRDGDIDFLFAESASDSIFWYENDGQEIFTKQLITSTAGGADSARLGDIDGDGDFDVFAAKKDTGALGYYKNDGSQNFTDISFPPGLSAREVRVADVDSDGDLDLLTGHSANRGVRWFENYLFTLGLQSNISELSEDSTDSATITFTRAGILTEEAVIAFEFDGNAEYGVDYEVLGATVFSGKEGTITFPENEASISLQITSIADDFLELAKNLQITIPEQENKNYLLGDQTTVSLNLVQENTDVVADYGDAPFPYPTDVPTGHTPFGPTLGTLRDSETTGMPSVNADGDGADDDGVAFSELHVGQTGATAIVEVQNAPEGARLDAWIDFNGDGSWQGAGERIAGSLEVVNGQNVVQFSVPSNAMSGETYARFRLSTSGGLGIVDLATDGEIEDYLVTINTPLTVVGLSPSPNLIPSSNGTAEFIIPADVDRDGDIDIVSRVNGPVVWFENLGAGQFVEHLAFNYSADTVRVVDLDKDGDFDFVTDVGWFENDGEQNFTRQNNQSSYPSVHTLDVADIDNDGDWDVLAVTTSRSSIRWYENDGHQNFSLRLSLSSTFDTDEVYKVQARDMDRDGDLDFIAGSNGFFGKVSLYENNGLHDFTERTIDNSRDHTAFEVIDYDRDGDFDVITISENSDKIYLLENDGAGDFVKHLITTEIDGPTSLFVSDIDGDADLDLLVASKDGSGVSILQYANSHEFLLVPVIMPDENNERDFVDAIAADIDQDGDLDLLAAPRFEDELLWYESIPDGVLASVTQTSITEDSGGVAKFIFTRTVNLKEQVDFQFQVGGTAEYGVDYEVSGATSYSGSSGIVTFAAAVATAEIMIIPISDDDFEDHETVTLELANIAGLIPFSQDLSAVQPTIIILRDEPVDYGDAPRSYSTDDLQAAAHAPIGPTLGLTRDAELNGQPSVASDGDGADEDGVTFSPIRVGQVDASVTVNVQNAPTGARLDAWFDFDGDGTFNGAHELIAARLDVIEGDNLVRFSVPTSINSGSTYARFRLSTEGGHSPTGFAADGEVEDYQVVLLPPASSGGAFSNQGQVGNSPIVGQILEAADLDKDGDLDLVTAGFELQLQWHENVGNGDYVTHDITPEAFSPSEMELIDFDRDGDLDVLAVGISYVWFENDGSQTFTSHMIAEVTRGASNLMAVDIDNDGDLDVLSTEEYSFGFNSLPARALWHENLGDGNFQTRQIATLDDYPFAEEHLAVGDLDNDGDPDLVVGPTDDFGRGLDWYENDGQGNFARHEITPTFPGTDRVWLPSRVNSTQLVDQNRDGNLDLVYTTSFGFPGWISGDGEGGFVHSGSIPSNSPFESSLIPLDVDGDSDLDWFYALPSSGSFSWYSNDGAATPRLNLEHELKTDAFYYDSLVLADFDIDGDIDALTVRAADKVVVWHENIAPDAGDFDSNETIDGFDFLAWQRGHGTSDNATREQGDADADGDVEADDLNDWRGTYGYEAPQPSADFNSYNGVDGHDFLTWQRGTTISFGAGRTAGDANLDRAVDGQDLAIWISSYGAQESLVDSSFALASATSANATLTENEPASAINLSPSKASLIDVALAFEWTDKKASRQESQILDLGHVIEPHSYPVSLEQAGANPTLASAEDSEIINPESPSDSEEEPWLSDQLLEEIFG
ncbi:FG-GAP-like repeat-containing protein [Adhaeretor mobilis]|uniref:FG-GAP repeat protein n=1 Tax=Adhaeretor mobilis TaxID=1930276 RepID=A0A517N0Q8_9BACT|nr:FG-GAP-like repeat-containing protein [Adhaeretor mobilis]QDT00720.1 FG-GAP repeat protein [Adhaeretor mobilis]